jgi:hypothetical protein
MMGSFRPSLFNTNISLGFFDKKYSPCWEQLLY